MLAPLSVILSGAQERSEYAVWKPRPVEPAAVLKTSTVACPDGYECYPKGTGAWFTTSELLQIDKKLIYLEGQVNQLKTLKMKRFGFCAGLGGTVGPELNGGQSGITGSLGATALFGWRF